MQLKFARVRPLLLLLAILAGTGWPAKQEASRPSIDSLLQQKKLDEVSVAPTSRSLILRASHILLIQVVSAKPGSWITDQTGNQKRTVSLSIRLEETLKGIVQQARGDQIRITVDQTGRQETFYNPAPGVWSDQPIDPGTRLLAFSRSLSKQVADLLVEPSCETLLSPDEYLLDVRLAMQAETEKLTLSDLLKRAQPSVASLNYLFAEYVTVKFDHSLLQDVNDFRLLMSFMEDPALSFVARSTLLTLVHSKLIAAAPAPIPYVQALTVSMFHLIGLPQASALRSNIILVYLPNLLGFARGGAAGRKAEDVFRGIPEERQKAERALEGLRGQPAALTLLRWLRE